MSRSSTKQNRQVPIDDKNEAFNTKTQKIQTCEPSSHDIVVESNGKMLRNDAFWKVVKLFTDQYKIATSKMEKSLVQCIVLDVLQSRRFRFVIQSHHDKKEYKELTYEGITVWNTVKEALSMENQ
jgi:hypothetical protein